jgi:DNA-directed RNA polymerase specialized sigma24 family protein
VSRLAATLKPEYAEALEAIEIGGTSVKTFAEAKGLSASNAAVRVYCARSPEKASDAIVWDLCGARVYELHV